MARQEPSQTPWPVDGAAYARDLAQRRGLDQDRVLRLLERAGRECGEFELANVGPHEILARLDEACDRIAPEQALVHFEQTDLLPRYVFRHGIPQYLAHEETPLYTLDELADLLEAFAAHLERNRALLTTTGHPLTSFSASRWIELHLGRLYHVKIPTSLTLAPGEDGLLVYRYEWSGTSSMRSPSEHGEALDTSGSYETASLIAGLSAEDAAHLGASRTRFFELKVRVLQTLAKALRLRDTDKLVDRVLQDLASVLLHDEAAFLLHQDRLYRPQHYSIAEDLELQCHPYVQHVPRNQPGGLSDLLHVAGHCAIELAEGRLDWAKKRLLRIASRFSQSDWRSVLGTRYVDAIDKPWRQDLEEILDALFIYQFVSEHPDRSRGFDRQIARALEGEFRSTIKLNVTAKRTHLADLKAYLRPIIEFAAAHLEATGTLPPLQLPTSEPTPGDGGNVFRQEGDGWSITYGGTKVQQKDSKGLRYIHVLVGYPGREFSAIDLINFVEKPAAAGARDVGEIAAEQLAESGLSVQASVSGLDPLLDDQARREYEARREALVAKLNRTTDKTAIRNIKREIDDIAAALDASLSPSGRPRHFATDAKRAKQAVGKSIQRALKHLEPAHPDFCEHLRGSLRIGAHYSYAPAARRSWDL